MAVAQQIAPKKRYLDAIISNMNYEGGCNPVNVVYITGLGWKRWRDIVHQYAQNDFRVLPPTGLPLGNIQGGFAWLENYKQELGELCFPPDGASTNPYPFYDRWGDSFNTTTEFVVVDQARSLATLAFLMAQTSSAASPGKNSIGTITGLPQTVPATLDVQRVRWVNAMDYGFYCGDHHIHVAGCAHYTSPTEGILDKTHFVFHISECY